MQPDYCDKYIKDAFFVFFSRQVIKSGPTSNYFNREATITSPVGATELRRAHILLPSMNYSNTSCSHQEEISILKHQMTEELFSFLAITLLQ